MVTIGVGCTAAQTISKPTLISIGYASGAASTEPKQAPVPPSRSRHSAL
jgi:hypothetical protein